jgi:hypothetical protein
MLRLTAIWLIVAGALFAANPRAQGPSPTPFDRLPAHVFDVTPPTEHVAGVPGQMAARPGACRTLPVAEARQRLIALAVQEWAFFGFPVVEYDDDDDAGPAGRVGGAGPGAFTPGAQRGRRSSRVGTPEAARTAASIAGYWAVTPGGAWILENQNEYWREAVSGVTRWRFPWSAAFISWLMCEGGLGTSAAFQRAIAHHTYIDQAIRARDGATAGTAYVAYDTGDEAIAPGDLLCSSRQPVFRTLAERRRQLGQGARTHCDLVVKVDESAGRILAIGGNVRGVVGLKVLPSTREGGRLRPAMPAGLSSSRPLFAHLRLRGPAAPAALTAFDDSPTFRAITCAGAAQSATRQSAALRQLIPPATRCAD